MNKLFAATAITLATAASAPAMAEMDNFFVGGEVGKAWIKSSQDIIDNFDDYKYGDPVQYGLRIGTYLDENVRVYVNLNQLKGDQSQHFSVTNGAGNTASLDAKSTITNRQLTLSADYLFDLDMPIKPFIGATVGANWTETKIEAVAKSNGAVVPEVTDDETKSSTAFAYGAQAGVVGQWGDFDVELGYRYLWHKNENDFDGSKFTTDNSQSAYLAVSYKF